MLGEKIGELQAKITGQRVIHGSDGQPEVETSYQGTGRIYGVETQEIGSYTGRLAPGGVIHGRGQGVAMTKDGDALSWTGHGVGKPTGKGMAASWRASLVYQTLSQKLTRVNTIVGVVEWEIDENGNGRASVFEWK